MSESFVYTIFIDAPIERIFTALTDGAFTRAYWAGRRIESGWTKGAAVHLYLDDTSDFEVSGEVLESDPPKLLSYTWSRRDARDEAPSRVTFELQPAGESVRLTLTHEPLPGGDNVRQGWSAIMSSLKSYLEAGKPLAATALYRRPKAA